MRRKNNSILVSIEISLNSDREKGAISINTAGGSYIKEREIEDNLKSIINLEFMTAEVEKRVKFYGPEERWAIRKNYIFL